MMYTGAEFSNEDLFGLLKKMVRRENVSSYEEYSGLIDSLLEEKKSYGFFADEEDIEQVRHVLESRWPEIERGLGSGIIVKIFGLPVLIPGWKMRRGRCFGLVSRAIVKCRVVG